MMDGNNGLAITFHVPNPISSLAVNKVDNILMAILHRHLCLAELAAVGFISEELTLADAIAPSFGADNDKFPVLRRRFVGSLATLAFLMDARLLTWVSLSCRTNTPCWLRQRKYRTPFTDPSFLPNNIIKIVTLKWQNLHVYSSNSTVQQ